MRRASASATGLFRAAFGCLPTRIAVVPGRVELLGNHTDYNAGLVLAATIDRTLEFAFAPRADGVIELVSSAFPRERIRFPAKQTAQVSGELWPDYVRAVLLELSRAGISVGGFNAAIHSTIPVGAGLSSSAALLVATALAAGNFPHRTTAERLRVAELCQRAEKRLGVDCGLLDYLTILHGRAGSAVRLDLRALTVRAIPWPQDIALVLADSGVRHQLADGGYNAIRRACEGAARKLGAATLREVRARSLSTAGLKLSARECGAARHIVEENARVAEAVRLLEGGRGSETAKLKAEPGRLKAEIDQSLLTAAATGDKGRRLGALFTASHESSRTQLRNSCPELDRLIIRANGLPGWLGGRLSGGGFGGMTVHVVRRQNLRRFMAGLPAECLAFECRFGAGARVGAIRGGGQT